jgi:hypothetical protein
MAACSAPSGGPLSSTSHLPKALTVLQSVCFLVTGLLLLVLTAPFYTPYEPLLFSVAPSLTEVVILPSSVWAFTVPRLVLDLVVVCTALGMIIGNKALLGVVLQTLRSSEHGSRTILYTFLFFLSIAIGSTVPSTQVLYA